MRRLSITVDPEGLAEVRRLVQVRTKRDAIERALQAFVRQHRLQELQGLAGSGVVEMALEELRRWRQSSLEAPEMARGIFLDTSTGMGDLRPHGWDDLKLAVPQVRTVAPVSTCWVVMAELLIGAREERGLTPLFEPLRALPEMPVTHQLWDAAARLGYPVRRRGITMPLPDLVSA